MMTRLQFDRERFRKLLALLGVLLLAGFAVIQAAHFHFDAGTAGDSHCAICLLLHTPATLVVAAIVLPVLACVRAQVLVLEPQLRSFGAIAPPYSRPPPTL
jgi:hypothetical protein